MIWGNSPSSSHLILGKKTCLLKCWTVPLMWYNCSWSRMFGWDITLWGIILCVQHFCFSYFLKSWYLHSVLTLDAQIHSCICIEIFLFFAAIVTHFVQSTRDFVFFGTLQRRQETARGLACSRIKTAEPVGDSSLSLLNNFKHVFFFLSFFPFVCRFRETFWNRV